MFKKKNKMAEEQVLRWVQVHQAHAANCGFSPALTHFQEDTGGILCSNLSPSNILA